MLANRPRAPGIGPLGPRRGGSLSDVVWRLAWPFLVSTILACAMIICIIVIGALEIASLAKGTDTFFYGNTASTGAGLWCGLFFTIAAVFILMINYLPRTYLWATIALIATIVAACFAVILLGLDAKAVQDGTYFGSLYYDKTKILAAQLAFAIFELLLCLAFIGVYIAILILARRRLRPQQRGFVY